MIVVCDVNTIWRLRPFAALARITDVLGLSPRGYGSNPQIKGLPCGNMPVVDALLPPGWASKSSAIGQRLLWGKIRKEIEIRNKSISCLIVTSPHYAQLLRILPPHIVTAYYASDDYRSYAGWRNVKELEKEIAHRVDHSFFVSEALRQRAVNDYSIDSSKTSVSMNATEDRFFPSSKATAPSSAPNGNPLERPIAGVIGGINERLDFDLLCRCADLDNIGTLLLVGQIPKTPPPALSKLLKHRKCVSVGHQPHADIHSWFKCIDVGLIPYSETQLNKFCSPMRLFDHLATGVPIVATSACDQVLDFKDRVAVCTCSDEYIAKTQRFLADRTSLTIKSPPSGITWDDRAKRIKLFLAGNKI